jgi:hypothetical protein
VKQIGQLNTVKVHYGLLAPSRGAHQAGYSIRITNVDDSVLLLRK